MSPCLRSRIRTACLLGFVSGAAVMSIAAGPAAAATYPGAGSTFTGGTEGWQVKEAACNVPAVCEASGGYDANAGNPAGSLAAKAKITLNTAGLVKTTVVEESPDFTAGDGGAGQLSLQRQLVSTEPVNLTPNLTYVATLVDKTAGSEQKAIEETILAATGFGSNQGPVSLIAGHTYSIRIASEINSQVAAVGVTGESIADYDNVVLTGPGSNGGSGPGGGGGPGGGPGGGGGGAGSLTNSQLTSLIQAHGLVSPAALTQHGNKITVKAKCPARVGRTCKVTVQGLIKKHKPATNIRRAKIKKGKIKKLVLKVKPAAKSKVMAKKRLLFKVTVKAGTAKATVYKSLKLIKR